MVGHGGSSAGSYLADPTSPIPSHCASIVATSTLRVKLMFTLCINASEPVGDIKLLTLSVNREASKHISKDFHVLLQRINAPLSWQSTQITGLS